MRAREITNPEDVAEYYGLTSEGGVYLWETPGGFHPVNPGDWIVENGKRHHLVAKTEFEAHFAVAPEGEAIVALVLGPGETPESVGFRVYGTATGYEDPLPPQLIALDALLEPLVEAANA